MGTNVALAAEGSSFGEPIDDIAAEVVELLALADVETDVDARAELYRQAQDVYADLVVSIPLFMIAEHVTFNPSIKGSASYPAAEALNIGPTMEFNYSTLTKTP
jgi:ABC-type transport system substrate-binding protein